MYGYYYVIYDDVLKSDRICSVQVMQVTRVSGVEKGQAKMMKTGVARKTKRNAEFFLKSQPTF